MTNEIECPFNEPVPEGRETMEIPPHVREQLAAIEARSRVINGKLIARYDRSGDGNFADHFKTYDEIEGPRNRIEVDVLGRPLGARIAYHAGWRYSIDAQVPRDGTEAKDPAAAEAEGTSKDEQVIARGPDHSYRDRPPEKAHLCMQVLSVGACPHFGPACTHTATLAQVLARTRAKK